MILCKFRSAAKWITEFEVTNEAIRGYWGKRGYNNNAGISEPVFER
ncbi:MAG: hypothetical protein ACLFMM_08560 [Methanohalobium sp.]